MGANKLGLFIHLSRTFHYTQPFFIAIDSEKGIRKYTSHKNLHSPFNSKFFKSCSTSRREEAFSLQSNYLVITTTDIEKRVVKNPTF
jgi:hypothetical protein